MYSKAAFLSSLKAEAKIIKHLVTQVPADQLEYRPTPAQRSTLELMRYLSIVLAASGEYVVTGTWDHWGAAEAAGKDVTVATFAKAMDKQIKAVEKKLAKLGDAALKRKKTKHWNGQALTLGEGLVEMILKPAVAYRMQLFLYAKASGASTLGTSDCWFGKAEKKKKAAQA